MGMPPVPVAGQPITARDDAPWLSPAEMRAWLRLQAVVELLPGVLDGQLRRDAGLSHYEYLLLAMLSEAPERAMRLSALASATNATLTRLSHVMDRLEARGLVRRSTCATDRRATIASLTEDGWDTVVASAPGHAATVRHHVFDVLTPEQVDVLATAMTQVLRTLDPDNRLRVLTATPHG